MPGSGAKALGAWLCAVILLGSCGPERTDLPADLFGADWAPWALHDPQNALVIGVASLAWLVLLWLAVGFLAVLASRSVGRTGRWSARVARLLLPRLLRTGLEALVGLTVAVGVAAPAVAAPTVGSPRAVVSFAAPQPVPSLDRAPARSIRLNPLPPVPPPVLAPTDPNTARHSQEPSGAPDEVVVRRGDCLWSVVARRLGSDATDREIAHAWPAWFEANRSVIGSDPGLLLPGQRLQVPHPA